MRWQRGLNAKLGPLGLTQPQFALLAAAGWLSSNGTDPPQQEIAEFLALDRMHVSQIVSRLEANGLVSRHTSATNARVKLVGLTEAGWERLRQAVPLVEIYDRGFFAR
jgi:DNA-binding MarR family transcriptional regulator